MNVRVITVLSSPCDFRVAVWSREELLVGAASSAHEKAIETGLSASASVTKMICSGRLQSVKVLQADRHPAILNILSFSSRLALLGELRPGH